MPRKKIHAIVEIPVLDPLKDRLYVQAITYLADDGRHFTQPKMDLLDEASQALMGLFAKAQGLEVIDVHGERE